LDSPGSELRNRDRNAALLALDRQMADYRPYLELTREELRSRARTAPPAEQKLLHQLDTGWGPIQMYFRLSPADLNGLRSGQKLTFTTTPKPGQQPLPADLADAIRQRLSDDIVRRREALALFAGKKGAVAVSPEAYTDPMRPEVTVWIVQSEIGQFVFEGNFGLLSTVPSPIPNALQGSGRLAIGECPTARNPNNAAANARFATELALRPRITLDPKSSCRPEFFPNSSRMWGEALEERKADSRQSELGRGASPPQRGAAEGERDVAPEPKVTSADVLEALHRAAGLPIIADFYTRLYKPGEVSVRDQPLFDALNQVGDTMRLRWRKDGNWLQFRSASFHDDRLKEVPNRLLTRWASSRRQNGALTLEDIISIAQLSDAQLDGAAMAEGARECWGLAEWDLARHQRLRPHWRYLAAFTPVQRQEAMSASGLAFTRMSLPQQQQFLALAFGAQENGPQVNLEDLAQAALHVKYIPQGWFQWATEPFKQGPLQAPPVLERTPEAALKKARQIDIQATEAQVTRTQWNGSFAYVRGSPDRRFATCFIDVNPHTEMYLGGP
jgi:hypothetical protein